MPPHEIDIDKIMESLPAKEWKRLFPSRGGAFFERRCTGDIFDFSAADLTQLKTIIDKGLFIVKDRKRFFSGV